MKRPGTEASRTQIESLKPNREITKNSNSQNTTRAIDQPIEQLFLKRLSLSNPNRTKNNINTCKVKYFPLKKNLLFSKLNDIDIKIETEFL